MLPPFRVFVLAKFAEIIQITASLSRYHFQNCNDIGDEYNK